MAASAGHWAVPDTSRRQPDRASGEGVGASLAAAPVRIARSPAGSRSGQQISLAETTATIGTCRKVCQHTEYCHLPYGKSSAAVPYVDIVCSIRCKSDARFGLSQALLRRCRCPFLFFLLLAAGKKKIPFSIFLAAEATTPVRLRS